MKFEILRGADDSAPIEEFDFEVELIELSARAIKYIFTFANPISISIGSKPDVFRKTIIKENLFISKETGRTIKLGT